MGTTPRLQINRARINTIVKKRDERTKTVSGWRAKLKGAWNKMVGVSICRHRNAPRIRPSAYASAVCRASHGAWLITFCPIPNGNGGRTHRVSYDSV